SRRPSAPPAWENSFRFSRPCKGLWDRNRTADPKADGGECKKGGGGGGGRHPSPRSCDGTARRFRIRPITVHNYKFGGGGERPMDRRDLEKLHAAVEWLLGQGSFSRAVQHLRVQLGGSQEPFVWTTIGLDTIHIALPAAIKSCWIFLLKRDVPSGSHFHP